MLQSLMQQQLQPNSEWTRHVYMQSQRDAYLCRVLQHWFNRSVPMPQECPRRSLRLSEKHTWTTLECVVGSHCVRLCSHCQRHWAADVQGSPLCLPAGHRRWLLEWIPAWGHMAEWRSDGDRPASEGPQPWLLLSMDNSIFSICLSIRMVALPMLLSEKLH